VTRAGVVAGADARQRAVRLAGALAELGVTGLVLKKSDGSAAELRARETDLPGVILASPGFVLSSAGLGVEVTISGDRLEWTARDAGAAAALQQALDNPAVESA